MSSKYGVLSSRPLDPHIATSCSKCHVPFEFAPPQPHPAPGTLLEIRCYSCQATVSHAFYPTQLPSSRGQMSPTPTPGPSHTQQPQQARKGGRKIGTQDRPLETGYYDLLGVPITATADEVKKAYRRLAIKHHPDKNPDDPDAAQRFNEIAIAYQTLSDPALRAKYNEFGPKESAPDGGFVDPEEVFGAMFGGERFAPIIGTISLARDMKSALQEADDSEIGDKASPEEKAKKDEREKVRSAQKAAERKERIQKLVEELERKLSIFTESATGPNDPDVTHSWKTICQLEAESLKEESYGPDLLACIGFVYVSKAKAHLATNQTFLGVGGWLHNVQGKYHVFSETVSTLRSAIELKTIFEQLQAAEKAGNISPEDKKRLEEEAAEKGIKALFKGAKLEIESVLRETCDTVLEFSNGGQASSAALSPDKALLRATALRILGDAYVAAGVPATEKIAAGGATEEDEYVRIDTKESRARETRR